MTNPDSLQAICAELRANSDEGMCGSSFTKLQMADLIFRLERLDAEMRKELIIKDASITQLQNLVLTEREELRARLAACEDGEVSYAIYQDDEWQAEADSLPDALHYAMMYGQDGPVRMEKIIRIPMDTPTAHPDVPGGAA